MLFPTRTSGQIFFKMQPLQSDERREPPAAQSQLFFADAFTHVQQWRTQKGGGQGAAAVGTPPQTPGRLRRKNVAGGSSLPDPFLKGF